MNPDLKQWLMVLTPTLVPTIAVLIGILMNATALNGLGHRVDDTNKRLDGVNRRIDDLRDSFNTRLTTFRRCGALNCIVWKES